MTTPNKTIDEIAEKFFAERFQPSNHQTCRDAILESTAQLQQELADAKQDRDKWREMAKELVEVVKNGVEHPNWNFNVTCGGDKALSKFNTMQKEGDEK